VSGPLNDPVCGMTVTEDSPHVLQQAGKPVYFCSAGCKAKFAADPALYSATPSVRLGVDSPPINRDTPISPSFPTTAISADAPFSMTYNSETMAAIGK
jgi:YHS domain-containing protein